MGWFGSSSTTTQVQAPSSTSIDPQQRAMLDNVYGQASEVEQRPYVPYTGQTVADFDPLQLQGQNGIVAGAQSNIGSGYLDEAGAAARGAAGWTPSQVQAGQVQPGQFKDVNLSPYMNPFIQNVVDTTTSAMDRSRQIQQVGDEDKALAAGAYGGDRHGVMDAETNKNYFDSLGRTLSGLYSTGFDRASDLAVGDINRKYQADTGNADRSLNAGEFNSTMGLQKANLGLSASQILAGLSQQQRSQFFQNQGLISQVGQDRQAQSQANLDDQYARFKEGQMYPQQAVSWLSNIVNGMPIMGGTSSGGSTSSTTSSNPSALSKIGSILGTVGMIGSFFSDENVKSDVKGLDTEDGVLKGLKKTPVKTWRYDPSKGGPDDGMVPHIGPMAQDMKRNLGIGDGHSLPVVDVLGAHHAAINSLARKVDRIVPRRVK